MLMRSPAEQGDLPPPLESRLALVEECLVKIAGGETPDFDLRNLRTVLRGLLDVVKPDAKIAAAVDEVFEAALACQGEFAHAAKAGSDTAYRFVLLAAGRMERSLPALRSTLRSAKPSGSNNAAAVLW
jgi:hypothetical protein